MTQILRAVALACCLASVPVAAGAQASKPKSAARPAKAPAKAPVFNLGTWIHPVTTQSPEAQKYFDQGLNLCYAFNHAQAITAFEQAAALDSTLAMAHWGIALAYGPNINMPMDSTAEVPAWRALQRALALSMHASDAERDYIQALAKRYSDPRAGQRPTRAGMDSAYADAMREVWKRNPNDSDAGTLFAEALMDLNPWNFWSLDGKAAPGTDEIVSTLEAVLALAPNNPGANHYYIHAVEASKNPQRAVPAADRLGSMAPDAGHLVHMPGHIYDQVGRFADSEIANVKAARVDSLYVAKYKPQSVYPMMYYPHNVHFIWSAASNQGRSKAAIAAARRLEPLVPVDMLRQMPVFQFVAPTTTYALVRFGRWKEVLAQPAPPMDLRFARGMWHYARGLAFNATNEFGEARVELDSVQAIAKATAPEEMVSFNSSAALLRLAGHALAGEMAARRDRTSEAVAQLRAAIQEEDSLHYDEPPAWFLPVRQQLGAVMLEAGMLEDAEKAYREDLERNPENGWSLFGLAKVLRARGANAEAADVEKRFEKAWSRADVKLTASRF